MYTSVTVVALVSFFAIPTPPTGVRWHTDYNRAQTEAKKEGKPLAVFIGSDSTRYAGMSQDGRLAASTAMYLAANYVCLYADTQDETGRRLADELAISQGRGLVISDRTGQLQAFCHDGDL